MTAEEQFIRHAVKHIEDGRRDAEIKGPYAFAVGIKSPWEYFYQLGYRLGEIEMQAVGEKIYRPPLTYKWLKHWRKLRAWTRSFRREE